MASGERILPDSVANAFTAVAGTDFKFVFSFDYAALGAWKIDDVVMYLQRFGGHASYHRHNGLPMVTTFEGPASADDWIKIKSRAPCFLVPEWDSQGIDYALSKSVVDGYSSWSAWPAGPNDMTTVIDWGNKRKLGGRVYMMPVSPWFFTNLPGWGKNWLWRSDNLWNKRWAQVLEVQPDYVQILTWNDVSTFFFFSSFLYLSTRPGCCGFPLGTPPRRLGRPEPRAYQPDTHPSLANPTTSAL